MDKQKDNKILRRFFKEKQLTLFSSLLITISFVALTILTLSSPKPQLTDEQLYQNAIADAMLSEEAEVIPLVSLTTDDEMTSWNGDRVLLLTLHQQPEVYIEGMTIKLKNEVWTFTDKEFEAWFNENQKDVADWSLRLKQLIGVPATSPYHYVSAMWTLPSDVIRPANKIDVRDASMSLTLDESLPEAYQTWFNGNILYSYYEDSYPWTRLGYTYDWADDCDEYGLTEFLIQPDANVYIEFTQPIEDFIKYLTLQ